MHQQTTELDRHLRNIDRKRDRARRQKNARVHFRDETFASFERACCGTFALEQLRFADELEQVTCRGCRRCLELRRARLCGASAR